MSLLRFASVMAVTAGVASCASHTIYSDEKFASETPFSKRVQGTGETVCWSVKRAFLTQGYMLERTSDPVIVTGTKDVQEDETNETLRLQATCVDNHDGTSTVFSSATYEVSTLQRAPQTVSAGVSLATITLPAGTEKALRLQKRETVKDPKFYERFYALVQQFADQEAQNAGREAPSASAGRSSR